MSIIYSANRKASLLLNAVQDPDSEAYYTIQYRPPVWEAEKVYIENTTADTGDLVCPITNNGFYYEAISSGKTGLTEPIWATVENGETVDGTVVWIAKPDDFLLRFGDTITNSIWSIDPVTAVLSNDGILNGLTFVKVALDSSITSFKLTNSITVTRLSSVEEKFDRSIKVKVKEK